MIMYLFCFIVVLWLPVGQSHSQGRLANTGSELSEHADPNGARAYLDLGVISIPAPPVYQQVGDWTHVHKVTFRCPDIHMVTTLQLQMVSLLNARDSILGLTPKSHAAAVRRLLESTLRPSLELFSESLADLDRASGRLKAITMTSWSPGLEPLCAEGSQSRRSVLPFVGKLYQWLFGLATESDIEAISSILEKLNSKTDILSEGLHTLEDAQASFTSTIQTELVNVSHALAESVDKVSSRLSDWESKSEAMSKWVTGAVSELRYQLMILEIAVAMDAVTGRVSALHRGVIYLTSVAESIHESLVSGMVHTSFISHALLNQVIANARAQETSAATVPPTVTSLSLMRSQVLKVIIAPGVVMLSIKIPLTVRSLPEMYQLVSVPFVHQGDWVHMIPEPEFVLVDMATRRWAVVAPTTIVACSQDPLRVCRVPLVWNTVGMDHCSVCLALGIPIGNTTCRLTRVEKPASLPVMQGAGVGSWLVSGGGGKLNIRRSCAQDGLGSASREIIIGLAIVRVEPGCRLELDDLVAVGSMHFYDLTQSQDLIMMNVGTGRPVAVGPLDFDTAANITILRPVQSRETVDLVNIMTNTSRLDLASTERETHRRMAKVEGESARISGAVQAELARIQSGLGFQWYDILVWISVAVGIVVSAYCLIRRAPSCLPAAALAGSIPMVDARPVGGTSLDDLNLHVWVTVGATILVLAVKLWHWAHQARQHRVLTHMLGKQVGYCPVNQAVVQHPGELRVIATFSCQIQQLCRKSLGISVPIQICTIPGVASDWMMISGMIPGRVMPAPPRWIGCSGVTFGLTWEPSCLTHREHGDIQASDALPDEVCIPYRELEATVRYPSAAWLQWYKVDALTNISVVGIGGSTPLWQYTHNDDALEDI